MVTFQIFALVAAVVGSGLKSPFAQAFSFIDNRPQSYSTTRQISSFCGPSRMHSVFMAGPSTVEKEFVRTRGPATLERPEPVLTKRDTNSRKQREGNGHEAWEVRIYNDGLNTREHVARSLVQVTGMSEMNAYQTMMQAHINGLATVGRYIFEIAEMFHVALKKNGIVCDIVPVEES